MRIVVTGSSKATNRQPVWDVLDKVHAEVGITVLIEGEAPGVDTFAREWAEERGIPVERYPAQWGDMSPPCVRRIGRYGEYNAVAGVKRNTQMIVEGKPDMLVPFKGGRGTTNMRSQCYVAGIPFWGDEVQGQLL